MVQAMVALLPLPVMPSRVWNRRPARCRLGQRLDGCGLVARGREVGHHAGTEPAWARMICRSDFTAGSDIPSGYPGG